MVKKTIYLTKYKTTKIRILMDLIIPNLTKISNSKEMIINNKVNNKIIKNKTRIINNRIPKITTININRVKIRVSTKIIQIRTCKMEILPKIRLI